MAPRWPAIELASGYGLARVLLLVNACPACRLRAEHVHGVLAPLDWAPLPEPRDEPVRPMRWERVA
jgi:hypothetical protein